MLGVAALFLAIAVLVYTRANLSIPLLYETEARYLQHVRPADAELVPFLAKLLPQLGSLLWNASLARPDGLRDQPIPMSHVRPWVDAHQLSSGEGDAIVRTRRIAAFAHRWHLAHTEKITVLLASMGQRDELDLRIPLDASLVYSSGRIGRSYVTGIAREGTIRIQRVGSSRARIQLHASIPTYGIAPTDQSRTEPAWVTISENWLVRIEAWEKESSEGDSFFLDVKGYRQALGLPLTFSSNPPLDLTSGEPSRHDRQAPRTLL